MTAALSETYRRISVQPLTTALGAEIGGVDLSRPLDAETLAEIHRAFLSYQVIFFRDQNLEPAQHAAFARHFGTLNVHPYIKGMEAHPEVMELIKEPDETVNVGEDWHSDMSFMAEPVLGSILYAVQVPEYGGDTLFASQYAAYEALSDGMKRMLDPLEAIHGVAHVYNAGRTATRKSMKIQAADESAATYAHPVVRTHPETRRKALYVNTCFTLKFKDMSEKESAALLGFLCRHATQEQFTCRFRWRPGSVAFWDNRCTQHSALNDYHGKRRHMRRVTVNGDRPFY